MKVVKDYITACNFDQIAMGHIERGALNTIDIKIGENFVRVPEYIITEQCEKYTKECLVRLRRTLEAEMMLIEKFYGADAKSKALRAEINKHMHTAFKDISDPKFDLIEGGIFSGISTGRDFETGDKHP